jgi:hypothetical protein
MKTIAAALAILAVTPAFAATTITLDFEGAAGYVNSIRDFYNGGIDSLGRSGPNYGVSFTEAAVALSNDALGPYYSHAPSPLTVMYAYDSSAVMNVAQGFVDRLTFYYSSSDAVLDAVNIYSGLNGSGTLLASASLSGNAGLGCSDSAYCRFDLTSVKFAGVAKSVSFGGNAPFVAYDNVTITPVPVPEPATYLMLAAGLLGVALTKSRRGD